MKNVGRIFIEADGVLMERADYNFPAGIAEQGFYESRIPEWNMISALKDVLGDSPELPVQILCHVPLALKYAKEECAMWMSQYFRDACGIRFLPYGEFGSYIALREDDLLLSAHVGNLALFSFRSRHGIGVDIDADAVPGFSSVKTSDRPEQIAKVIRGSF